MGCNSTSFQKGQPRPLGAGRKKGTPNKDHEGLRQIARCYGPEAVHKLAELAGLVPGKKGSKDERTVAYCCDRLLDRGYGKPVQPMANDQDNPFAPLMQWLDGRTRGVPSMHPEYANGEKWRSSSLSNEAEAQNWRRDAYPTLT